VRPYDPAAFQSFIDASSGKPYNRNAEVYWKKVDATVEEYIDHPESKFRNGGKAGKMHAWHYQKAVARRRLSRNMFVI